MPYVYKDPNVVVETHETRIVEDRTGSGWSVAIILAVVVVLGLVGYFAFAGPSTTTIVETPAVGRGQDIHVDAPTVNVQPPVVNVQPPVVNGNTSPPPDNETTKLGSESGN